MSIQPSDIEVLPDTLREHHLVTDFTIPNTSRDSEVPIWAELGQKLTGYLPSIGAEFADPASFTSCDLPVSSNQSSQTAHHHLPWLFLTAGKLNRQRRKIISAGPLTFSPRTLCSNSVGGAWGPAASGTPNQPLIFVGTSISRVDCVSHGKQELRFSGSCRTT